MMQGYGGKKCNSLSTQGRDMFFIFFFSVLNVQSPHQRTVSHSFSTKTMLTIKGSTIIILSAYASLGPVDANIKTNKRQWLSCRKYAR